MSVRATSSEYETYQFVESGGWKPSLSGWQFHPHPARPVIISLQLPKHSTCRAVAWGSGLVGTALLIWGLAKIINPDPIDDDNMIGKTLSISGGFLLFITLLALCRIHGRCPRVCRKEQENPLLPRG